MRLWLANDSEQRICHIFRVDRGRFIVIPPGDDSPVSWRNTWISETEQGYWTQVHTVWGTQETGNYPQFTSWLAGIDYKRIVFFPAWQQANTNQMYWDTDWGTEVASHSQKQAVLRLSANVSLSALGETGNSQWHSWSRDFVLINNNMCAFNLSITVRNSLTYWNVFRALEKTSASNYILVWIGVFYRVYYITVSCV